MFFIEAGESLAPPSPETALTIELTFDGDPSGWFQLSLSPTAAAAVAANFLGEDRDSLTSAQFEEVAKELANMICGAALSRTESRATFRLAEPRLLRPPAAPCGDSLCTLETGSGPLTLAIRMEAKACPSSAKSAS